MNEVSNTNTVDTSKTTLSHNNVSVTLKRTETERVKEGKEATAYWTLDLATLRQSRPVWAKDDKGETVTKNGQPVQALDKDGNGIVEFDVDATLTTLGELFTYDTLEEYLQAKLNQNIRAAQMDAGKDVYDMDAKLTYAKAYITGGFGATRVVQKSPMELAQADFQGAVAMLKAKLEAKTIDKAAYDVAFKSELDKFQLKLVEITTNLAAKLS